MIGIAQAWKTRWDARNLDSQITGGITQTWAAERTDMPYACFTNVSDAKSAGTTASRYIRTVVQIDVYASTPDEAGRLAIVVREAFTNSNFAATNPFAMTDATVKRIEPEGAPVETQEGPEVFRSMQTFEIEWAENRNLVPAS